MLDKLLKKRFHFTNELYIINTASERSNSMQNNSIQIADNDDRYLLLDQYIDSYHDKKGISLNVLQKAQSLFGYLPLEVHKHISFKLGVPIAELYGVTTFYSQFTTEPKGKHTVSVCMGTVCYVKMAQQVIDEVSKILEIKVDQTTLDAMFTLEATRCLGCCSLAPVMMIDSDVYANINDTSEIWGIIKEYKEGSDDHVSI